MTVGRLEAVWYGRHPLGHLLAPLGWIWAGAARARRLAYRLGVLTSTRVECPVVVVGNLTVGGTGKTPLVVWICEFLRARGYRPGVVCRGWGGAARTWPQQVRGDSDPTVVGDEAVLLARRSGCPVAAGPDRVASARSLVRHAGCDVVVSDDGLQHLRLARDVEIAVLDAVRRHGNKRCLPAGPLREPLSRLRAVDAVVANGGALRGEFDMRLVPGDAVSVADPSLARPLESFRGAPVHAVCGIGHPQRFFDMLSGLGITVLAAPFPDHHPFRAEEVRFDDGAAVLMTEKDAVKCVRFADEHHWAVPVSARLPDAFGVRLARDLELRGGRRDGAPATGARSGGLAG